MISTTFLSAVFPHFCVRDKVKRDGPFPTMKGTKFDVIDRLPVSLVHPHKSFHNHVLLCGSGADSSSHNRVRLLPVPLSRNRAMVCLLAFFMFSTPLLGDEQQQHFADNEFKNFLHKSSSKLISFFCNLFSITFQTNSSQVTVCLNSNYFVITVKLD